ncbi:MAG: hypothetical protein NC818_01470 [Candidatus Omnitrophica bacterium]|nr:hypothetical protein [Candidatus Omnitrophota bacterium]
MNNTLKLLIKKPKLIPFALESYLREVIFRPDRSLKKGIDYIDESNDEWLKAAPIPSWRYEFGATVLNNEIYVIGGLSIPTVYNVLRKVEVYNVDNDTWREVVPFPVIIHHPAVASLNGKIYVLGGNGLRISAYSYVFEYNPKEYIWRRKRDMPTKRGAAGVAVHDNLIYVMGGAVPHGWKKKKVRKEFEAYNPHTDKWEILPPLPTPREHLASTTAGGLIFALGGYITSMFEPLDINEAYNPMTGKWEKRAPLPLPLCGFPAVGIDDSIFIFGGEQGWAISGHTYEYKILQDRWYRRKDMPLGRYAAVAVSLNNRIHVIGGKSLMFGYIFSNEHDVYIPPKD